MSKLQFDVSKAKTSRLIANLANAKVLASNMPEDCSVGEISHAFNEIANEIDRRLPQGRGK